MEHWTQERYDAFRRELYARQEEAYRQFHTKLLRSDLPVIGLRAPLLRKIAAEIAKEDGVGFLRICGRGTYEERLLYGLVAAALPVSYAEFLPYCDTYTETIVENWAHCDGFCASLKKRIKGHEAEFFEHIKRYLASENPWAVRVGLILMLNYYLTPAYLPQCWSGQMPSNPSSIMSAWDRRGCWQRLGRRTGTPVERIFLIIIWMLGYSASSFRRRVSPIVFRRRIRHICAACGRNERDSLL